MAEDNSSGPSRAGSPVDSLPDIPASASRPYRFTWDPTVRRGPGSVYSETTDGRDYFATAGTKVDVSGIVEGSLPVGVMPKDWSSSQYGFNAISTVLNNPYKKANPPKAHSALPVVPPSELPRVRRKDFESYLKAVGPEWERFLESSSLGREGAAQVNGSVAEPQTPTGPKTAFSLLDLNDPRTPRTPHDLFDVPPTPRTPRPNAQIPPLNTVPSVFFEPTFDLGNPRIFAEVAEQRDGTEEDQEMSSAIVMDKLSHYADTIELHLIREIALRSTSFFAALTNLHDLQTESEGCLDRIGKLRGLLREVDDQGAKKGLEIVRKEAKMKNVAVVQEGVKVVSGVVEMTAVAKSLVQAGQWGQALGVVDELHAMWSTESDGASTSTPKDRPRPVAIQPLNRRTTLTTVPESPSVENALASPSRTAPPIPLSSLQAFASLPEHLRTLTMDIAASLSGELVSVLRTDLLERIQPDLHVSSAEALNQSLKDRIRPLLQNLSRTSGIREATLSWREMVLLEVQVAVKRHVPQSGLDHDDLGGAKKVSQPQDELSQHLRSLSHVEFMKVARAIYKTLLNCIEGLRTQNGLIVEVLEANEPSSPQVKIADVQSDLFDILSSAAELANARASKVVTMRAEQHASLDLPEFMTFFEESWSFVVKCEIICKRMIVGLRGVVVSQAKAFLQTFHQNRITQSAKLVEEEQWAPVELTAAQQRIVTIIVESAVRDPPELLLGNKNANGTSPTMTNGNHPPPFSTSTTKANGEPRTTSKHLRIEDRPYFAVNALRDVLVLLVDYLKIIANLNMLTTEAMSRTIEFLKAFNSRTCQVVLGAGAMRSAGLKNITAKHLSLASQALSIMIGLIPYVREAFRRHFNPTQAVMLIEFDKLKRDYQEHQNEIHAKLIAIMGERLNAHCKMLQAVQWDVPRSGRNEYMEILVKETVTLHKVLSRYLAEQVVEYIMTQVFAAINHRLSEEYAKIDLPNQEAKDRLLTDVRFLHQKLSSLQGLAGQSTMLETIVSDKAVQRKSPFAGNERIRGMLQRQDSVSSLSSSPLSTHSNGPPGFSPSLANASNTSLGSSGVTGGASSPRPQSPLPGPSSPRPQSPLPPRPGTPVQRPGTPVYTPTTPRQDKPLPSPGGLASPAPPLRRSSLPPPSPTLNGTSSPVAQPTSPSLLNGRASVGDEEAGLQRRASSGVRQMQTNAEPASPAPATTEKIVVQQSAGDPLGVLDSPTKEPVIDTANTPSPIPSSSPESAKS